MAVERADCVFGMGKVHNPQLLPADSVKFCTFHFWFEGKYIKHEALFLGRRGFEKTHTTLLCKHFQKARNIHRILTLSVIKLTSLRALFGVVSYEMCPLMPLYFCCGTV